MNIHPQSTEERSPLAMPFIKWLSKESSQKAEKRDVKGKGEKERYIHLNSEFQRIAERDKKAFLSEQCKKKNQRKTIEWERLEIS